MTFLDLTDSDIEQGDIEHDTFVDEPRDTIVDVPREECILSDDELQENDLDLLRDCLECRMDAHYCNDKTHANYREVRNA